MSDANTPAADAVILQRFRKKPVVIDAYQLPPAGQDVPESFDDWCALVGFVEFESGRDEGLIIKTLEGDMTASPGDWIIMGVNGEFYPCKPDIFAKTYEPADASAPRESALIAERDALRGAAGWRPITAPGQVSVDDLVTFTIGDARHVRRVRRVLFAGRVQEELIYDTKRNHYLITSMSMRNEGSQKNVMFHKRPPLPALSAPAVEGV